MHTATAAQGFWAKVDRTAGPRGCWPWTASRDRDGYGWLGPKSIARKAHRAAYILAHGQIPPGMVVMHACDNPPCCNPAHLSVGTPGDNTRDAIAKGRALVGEINNSAKLTEAAVERIRHLHARGTTRLELAQRFGVCRRQINDIVTGRAWRHVGGPTIVVGERGRP